MKFEKCLAAVLMSFVMMTALSAKAQFAAGGGFGASVGGTGQIMANQSCPYQATGGDGASSYLDEYNEIKKAKADEVRKLSEMKRKNRQLEKDLEKSRDVITSVVDGRYSDAIISHMDNARLCTDYSYDKVSKTRSKGYQNDDDDEDSAPSENAQASLTPITGFSPSQWAQVCVQGKKGGVDGIVCSSAPYASADRGRYNASECKRALETYRKSSVDLQKIQTDMQRSEDLIARYTEDLPKSLREAKENYKADREAGTEGGICVDCMANGNGYVTQNQGPDWAGVAANGVTGALAMYAGYQQNKMVAEYNSKLGWPTQAVPTFGYGLPFVANAIYGAIGGGVGSGGFGCTGSAGGGGFQNGAGGGLGQFGQGPGYYGNVGMNGTSGYPVGYGGSPYGGGMYNGGMGPGGINVGGGLFGGLNGNNPYGALGGYQGFQGAGGYQGFQGAGGYQGFAGSIGGGYQGFQGIGGYQGFQGAGGYQGFQGAGGYQGFAGSIGFQGYQGVGGYQGYAGAGGYQGFQGVGGYQGMDGGLGSMQMQQAMMQMQMQQYQLQMQQQQQQQQNALVRYQTMAGIQSEIQSLVYKLNIVQSGGSLGTSYIGSGISGGISGGVSIGGSYGIGTGNIQGVIPAPGSGTTTVPGGVVIPAGSR